MPPTRLILILLLLTVIVSHKIVADLLLSKGYCITLFDDQGLDQSEKENKAGAEDETLVVHPSGHPALLQLNLGTKKIAAGNILVYLPAAYLEISNPPPEIFHPV
jgi:hypothetical protein